MITNEIISTLLKQACPSIQYRFRKEILEENPDFAEYRAAILDDSRVRYALSWQKENGFFGDFFHAGWIPAVKMKYFGTGTEAALRFLSEMGFTADYPEIKKCLDFLLTDGWNPDPWAWSKVFQPEIGLFGPDHVRAVAFAWFGTEQHPFIQAEIERSFGYVTGITGISSVDEITGTYGGKRCFLPGTPFPDLYCLKLLAFTQGWRTDTNVQSLATAVNRLIELSPLPPMYIKCKSQLIAPAAIQLPDYRRALPDISEKEWFWWMQGMELFARMGMVTKVEMLKNKALELRDLLEKGGVFFPFKPYARHFTQWGVYPGLALEDSWRRDKWRLDLTFRSLLILKYSSLLK